MVEVYFLDNDMLHVLDKILINSFMVLMVNKILKILTKENLGGFLLS